MMLFGNSAYAKFSCEQIKEKAVRKACIEDRDTSNGSPSESTNKVSVDTAPIVNWEYTEHKNEMRGTTTKIAETKSTNTIDLDFPYAGKQHGWISVLVDSEGESVHFFIKRGQIVCSDGSAYNKCSVLIKFDDSESVLFHAELLGDKGNHVIFTDDDFLQRVQAAKKVKIQIPFFQNGNRVFNFNVGNLKLE